jgi:hypothetical protein
MKTIILAAASILFFGVSSASADSLKVQPGLWKITRTNVSGPGKSRPDIGGVRTRCITKEALAQPEKTFDIPILMISLAEANTNATAPAPVACEYADIKETANSINFNYRCTGGYAFTREASVVFDSPTHFHEHVLVQVSLGDLRPIPPEVITEGTRVGDCDKATQEPGQPREH